MYSLTCCTVAQITHKDTTFNSAVAGAAVGLALGIRARSPNWMFAYALYGAATGGICKFFYLHPRTFRPKANYFEWMQDREQSMRPEYRKEMKGGYFMGPLKDGLKDVGVKVPESW